MTRSSAPAIAAILFFAGCDNMKTQPYTEPLAPSVFFADGASARPLPPGVVARDHLQTNELLYKGIQNGQLADVLPFSLNQAVLERGQERYAIFCTPCHDGLGNGKGIVVQRGFTPPPSFHLVRLQQAPLGHFFQVMTNGYGAMYSYADRVSAQDRWAVAAYIRTLQFSQAATLDDVPAREKARLEEERQ